MENNVYSSEEEFLKNYDSSQFEKLSMTADTLIFSVADEEYPPNKISKTVLKMQAFYTCFLKFCLALNSYIFTKNSSPTILVKERNDVKSVA